MLLILSGCTNPQPTESIINSTQEQITAIETSLPAECKTPAILEQINALKAQLSNIPTICKSELATEKEKTKKWTLATFALIGIIILILWNKLKRLIL